MQFTNTKREQFRASIRRQDREQVFSKKRIPYAVVQQQPEIEYEFKLESDSQELNQQLESLEYHLRTLTQENDEQQLIFQVQTHNLLQILMNLATFRDFPLYDKLSSIRLKNCRLALRCLISISIFDSQAKYIQIEYIFDEIMSRAEKQLQPIQQWELLISDLALLLSNMIVDINTDQVQLATKVINSNFFKIWKLIVANNQGSSGWQWIITLQKLIAQRENNEYSDYKVIEVISQQVQFLKLDQPDIDSCLTVLRCFAQGHPVQVSIMIRSVMEDLMKRFDNRSTSILLYSLFINITSYEHADIPTTDSPEFQLVKLGILEQIGKNIQRIQEEYDELMLKKIACLLNNMLTENIDRVKDFSLNFIPVFCQLINDHFDARLVDELLLFIKYLTKSRTNAYIIADNLIFYLAKFLVSDPSLLIKILEVIFIYDSFSQDLKTMLIYDIEQHQFQESVNFAFDKWPEALENLSLIEKYLGLIEDWRYIIKP